VSIDRSESRNIQQHNNSRDLQDFTFNVDISSKQKIIRDILGLSYTLDQMGLIDIYRGEKTQIKSEMKEETLPLIPQRYEGL